MSDVQLVRTETGWYVTPAPTVSDIEPLAESWPDTEPPPLTLTAHGGELWWPWCRDQEGHLDLGATLARPPYAMIDQISEAVDWLWALYGAELAVLTTSSEADLAPVAYSPGRPAVAQDAGRCAWGLWCWSWWPSSVIDAIPALSAELLAREILSLQDNLDIVLDEDAHRNELAASLEAATPSQSRFALAAGAPAATRSLGLRVSSGSCEYSWSDVPAGWLDSSARALTWRLEESVTRWRLQIRAGAGDSPGVAEHGALVGILVGEHDQPIQTCVLDLGSDGLGQCWQGEMEGAGPFHQAGTGGGSRVRLALVTGPVSAKMDRDSLPVVAGGAIPAWQDEVRKLARQRLQWAAAAPQESPDTAMEAGRPFQAEREAGNSR